MKDNQRKAMFAKLRFTSIRNNTNMTTVGQVESKVFKTRLQAEKFASNLGIKKKVKVLTVEKTQVGELIKKS